MSLTLQHRKELLQRAYISAIASIAGVNVHIDKAEFDYGIDGNFVIIRQASNGSLFPDGRLEFQMKASTEVSVKKNHITYNLDAKTYNKLVQRACDPAMLILLILPKEQEQWVSLSKDEMILRKCCYWHFLVDLPPSPNSQTVSIKIPINNVLTPEIIVKHLENFQAINSSNKEKFRELLGSGGVPC
jgi:hypothetical protein